MGYHVTATNVDLCWREGTDLDAVLATLKRTLLDPAVIQQHGRGGGNVYEVATGRWIHTRKYSWVDMAVLETATSVYEFIGEFVDSVEVEDADLGDWTFEFVSREGNEELLFQTLAPFLEDGSSIAWEGSDGARWLWGFRNGQMRSYAGELRYPGWEDATPIDAVDP
jgi:hypothetical protein